MKGILYFSIIRIKVNNILFDENKKFVLYINLEYIEDGSEKEAY